MSVKAGSITPPHGQTFEAIYPGVSQSVAIGAGSVQSTATQAGTTVVQVAATIACFLSIGTSPTAVANTSCYLPAGIARLYAVNPGDKIAVIQSTGAGTLYITEGA